MSTVAAPPLVVALPPAPSGRPTAAWLIGPWFDLLLVANLTWPLVAMAALFSPDWFTGPLSAVQIYFLSTPHRWITLVLVFMDGDRLRKQPGLFAGLAVALVGLGLALVALGHYWPDAGNSLIPLMMLDYVWNAWHFAAQHAGIARIYARVAGVQQTERAIAFEKSAIRTLALWVFFRLAVYLGQRQAPAALASLSWLWPWLGVIDLFVVMPPVVLLARELAAYQPRRFGRLVYILSMVTLYSATLWVIRAGDDATITALFLAGAVFHATEYLAIVSWSVRKKSSGAWRYVAPRYGVALLAFMTVMMITNMALAAHSLYTWGLVTLLVSLLHYGYDGIIWRSRPARQNNALTVLTADRRLALL